MGEEERQAGIAIPSLEEIQKKAMERKKTLLFQPNSAEPSSSSSTTAADSQTLAGQPSSTSRVSSSPTFSPTPTSTSTSSFASSASASASPSFTTPPRNRAQANTTSPESVRSGSSPRGAFQLIVNPNQKLNPILKHVRNVPYKFEDIEADYQMGRASCGLFLSFKYHRLHPQYIHYRIKKLGASDYLRVLFALVDVEDPQATLAEITKICLTHSFVVMLSWSPEECGRYLEMYKSFETKAPDLIKGKSGTDYVSKLTDCLTSVKSVNRTDVVTLASTFGSLHSISQASISEISLCPGFGMSKAKRVHDAFCEPFLPQKRPRANQ